MSRPGPQRYDSLQALRGVAALAVLACHLGQWAHLRGLNGLPEGPALGAYGVDIFFVLSGFIIMQSRLRTPHGLASAAGFLVNRAGRIYPAYLAVLAACLVAVSLGAGDWVSDIGRSDAAANLLLPSASPPLLHPAWTLAHELLFYGVFTVILAAPPRWAGPIIGLWIGVGLVSQVARWGQPEPPWLRLLANPLNLEFLAGAGLALGRRAPFSRARTLLLIGAAGWAAGAVLFVKGEWPHPPEFFRALLVGAPAWMIVYGAVSLDETSSWSPPRLLQRLGDRSYALYLVNFPICAAASRWMEQGRRHGAILAAYLVVATVLSFLAAEILHRRVERPALTHFRRLARWIASGRRAPAPSAPTAVIDTA